MHPSLLLAVLVVSLAGCATAPPPIPVPAKLTTGFEPARSGFDFANGLIWDYPEHGEAGDDRRTASSGVQGSDRDDYAHRCIPMVRTARQFYYGARFDASLPPLSSEGYAALLERLLAVDPRHEGPVEDPVVVPAFADLRSFSAAHGELLKQRTRSAQSTYLQRGNWRMIFAFPPVHQRNTAESLLAALSKGHPPIVRVLNFPNIDVNHALLIHAAEADATHVHFLSYDPNQPGKSVELSFDRELARFSLGRTPYFAGGPLKVYEIYSGTLY